jgi:hypothetical protein
MGYSITVNDASARDEILRLSRLSSDWQFAYGIAVLDPPAANGILDLDLKAV